MTRVRLGPLLATATHERVAIAACSVYSLAQAAGVIDAAVALRAPVILQAHPSGVGDLLAPLLTGLRRLADDAPMPVGIQLDHCAERSVIEAAWTAGCDGVMADGSTLDIEANAALVRAAVDSAPPTAGLVEAELGRLAGSEDGLTLDARTGKMTDPKTVRAFLDASGAHALAVCIGNVHGVSQRAPDLDLARLEAIRAQTEVPLVLHGASGLTPGLLRGCIERGVSKVNVNTELRLAFTGALSSVEPGDELIAILARARAMVADAAAHVIESLGSRGFVDLDWA